LQGSGARKEEEGRERGGGGAGVGPQHQAEHQQQLNVDQQHFTELTQGETFDKFAEFMCKIK
jgi:hypothetical protein